MQREAQGAGPESSRPLRPGPALGTRECGRAASGQARSNPQTPGRRARALGGRCSHPRVSHQKCVNKVSEGEAAEEAPRPPPTRRAPGARVGPTLTASSSARGRGERSPRLSGPVVGSHVCALGVVSWDTKRARALRKGAVPISPIYCESASGYKRRRVTGDSVVCAFKKVSRVQTGDITPTRAGCALGWTPPFQGPASPGFRVGQSPRSGPGLPKGVGSRGSGSRLPAARASVTNRRLPGAALRPRAPEAAAEYGFRRRGDRRLNPDPECPEGMGSPPTGLTSPRLETTVPPLDVCVGVGEGNPGRRYLSLWAKANWE